MNKKIKKGKEKKNPIKKFGSKIYGLLDRFLITPISRVIYQCSKFVKRHTGSFEGMLNRPHSLILFSLIVSIFVFVLVNSRAINLVETESEILSGQTIDVIYNEEKYVVEGIPDKVDIILMGRKSDLYLAKQLGDHKIVLDLSDYKTGEYTTKLKYNHSVASITYKLDPGTVTVKISEKESSIRTLTYDLLNQDKLDNKLNVSDVVLKESEVYVKGSKETLQRVASVKALIDVSTLDLIEAGSTDVDSLPMVAYDENGKVVDNVEIVPATASATIKVDSYYVDLPVRVVPTGKMATGYAISSATSSVSSVRVYGDQAILNTLSSIDAVIDVDGLSENKEFKVALSKPSGVRYLNESFATVNVTVGAEATREIEVGSIEQENLGSSYVANLVGDTDTKFIIILKGVESVINDIKPESISVYVDLSGFGPGTYNEVPVQVKGADLRATYTSKIQTVQVKVSNKS